MHLQKHKRAIHDNIQVPAQPLDASGPSPVLSDQFSRATGDSYWARIYRNTSERLYAAIGHASAEAQVLAFLGHKSAVLQGGQLVGMCLPKHKLYQEWMLLWIRSAESFF